MGWRGEGRFLGFPASTVKHYNVAEVCVFGGTPCNLYFCLPMENMRNISFQLACMILREANYWIPKTRSAPPIENG
uniref:Uncharacterized protein n=1 Tax=Manihot esculenta TaxID=3983 RepID=A0A2C9UI22_MANES